jgi:hypothetical protein
VNDEFRFEDDPEVQEDIRRRSRLNWLDRQFMSTSMLMLILFAFCCAGFAWPFGLAGVIACTDLRAKQNAKIVLAISLAVVAIQIVGRVLLVLAELHKQ